MTTPSNPWGLTEREVQVLEALAEHGCSKLAGRALGINHKTVDTYVFRCMRAIKVRNRWQAVVAFDRWHQLNRSLPDLPITRIERINMGLAVRLRQACMARAA